MRRRGTVTARAVTTHLNSKTLQRLTCWEKESRMRGNMGLDFAGQDVLASPLEMTAPLDLKILSVFALLLLKERMA